MYRVSMETGMTIREHIEELRTRTLHIAISIIVITIFCMSFGLKPFEYFDMQLAYPFPDPINNIAVNITHYMQKTLLPQDFHSRRESWPGTVRLIVPEAAPSIVEYEQPSWLFLDVSRWRQSICYLLRPVSSLLPASLVDEEIRLADLV